MINKIAVVGSRGFDFYSFFAEKLEQIISNLDGEIEYIIVKSSYKFCNLFGSYIIYSYIAGLNLNSEAS